MLRLQPQRYILSSSSPRCKRREDPLSGSLCNEAAPGVNIVSTSGHDPSKVDLSKGSSKVPSSTIHVKRPIRVQPPADLIMRNSNLVQHYCDHPHHEEGAVGIARQIYPGANYYYYSVSCMNQERRVTIGSTGLSPAPSLGRCPVFAWQSTTTVNHQRFHA